MKKYFLILILFISSLVFAQENSNKFPVTIDAENAFTLQKETKKPIVFFFYTDWCKYCFTMKKNTFTDDTIIQLLDDNFHFVLFNAESKNPVKVKNKTFENTSGVHDLVISLASKKGYMSYPSLVILNHKTRIDEQVDTFLSAEQLEELLTKYLKKKEKR